MPSPTPDAPEPSARGGSWIRIALIGFASMLVLLLVASILLVPAIAKNRLVEFLEGQTGGQAQVGKIRFNPLTLRAEVEQFGLTEAGAADPVIAFESLVIDARWLGFLSSDAELDALVLRGPLIRAELDEQGDFNLARLFASDEQEDPVREEEEQETPLVLELDALQVVGGHLLFRDRQRSPVFELPIEPLNLSALDLSTAAGRQGTYELQLSIGENTALSWAGSIATDPLASSGEVRLENFDLKWVAAYLAEQLQFELDSGGLNLRAGYALDLTNGLSLAIDEAVVALESVSMLDPKSGDEFFGVETIAVGPIAARVGDLGLESLAIEKASGSGGRAMTAREKDETIRLLELLTPAEPSKSVADAANSVVVEGATEVVEAVGEVIIGGEETSDEEAPAISVDAIRIEGFEFQFEDRVPATPVKIALSELLVDVKGYKSKPGARLAVEVEGKLGGNGRIQAAGPIQLAPVSGQLKVDLDGLSLGDFAPYLEGVAQLKIPEGALGAALEVDLSDKSGAPSVSVKGRAQIDDLKTLDRGNARRFVEWGSLRLEGLDYSSEELVLGEVVLKDAMARVVMDAKGKTNLETIFSSADSPTNGAKVPPQAETKSPSKSGEQGPPPSLKMRIDRVTLDHVGLAFADLGPVPNFTIDFAGLSGTVEGLSSEGGTRAKVNLEGRIDDTAPIRVLGQINPLAGDAYTDVTVRVSGISMPTFSPYSGRFAGLAIERGKLDLDLAYKLNANKLRAENRIELHEFNFGKAVESKDATKLPLRLASEVLRKPNGDIQLDIPLRGNLSDPSFNFVELATKTFANIITRIATTPFAIVGGLIPGQGEKIAKVQFEAGSATLSTAESADLAVLAEILVNKPALKVEIRGRVDPAVDEAGVRAELGNQDAIVDADWRVLARARAKAVHDALIALPGIDSERLFMVDVEVGGFADEDGRIATQLGLRMR